MPQSYRDRPPGFLAAAKDPGPPGPPTPQATLRISMFSSILKVPLNTSEVRSRWRRTFRELHSRCRRRNRRHRRHLRRLKSFRRIYESWEMVLNRGSRSSAGSCRLDLFRLGRPPRGGHTPTNNARALHLQPLHSLTTCVVCVPSEGEVLPFLVYIPGPLRESVVPQPDTLLLRALSPFLPDLDGKGFC